MPAAIKANRTIDDLDRISRSAACSTWASSSGGNEIDITDLPGEAFVSSIQAIIHAKLIKVTTFMTGSRYNPRRGT